MSINFEEVLARLQAEFIDSCTDKLDFVDTAIHEFGRETGQRGEIYLDVLREIHSIKGSAGTFGFTSITTIAHRLEDYIESTRRLSANEWLEVQKYIDAIREIVEGGEDLDEARTEEVLDALPSSAQPTIETKQGRTATLLLIMAQNVQRKLVGVELASIGFNVSFVESPTQAIDLALSIKPDAILSSQELAGVSGLELAGVFKAINATAKIPFIILTAHNKESISDINSANRVHVVSKGEGFLPTLCELLLSLDLFRRA